jgi:hypothetical protein
VIDASFLYVLRYFVKNCNVLLVSYDRYFVCDTISQIFLPSWILILFYLFGHLFVI